MPSASRTARAQRPSRLPRVAATGPPADHANQGRAAHSHRATRASHWRVDWRWSRPLSTTCSRRCAADGSRASAAQTRSSERAPRPVSERSRDESSVAASESTPASISGVSADLVQVDVPVSSLTTRSTAVSTCTLRCDGGSGRRHGRRMRCRWATRLLPRRCSVGRLVPRRALQTVASHASQDRRQGGAVLARPHGAPARTAQRAVDRQPRCRSTPRTRRARCLPSRRCEPSSPQARSNAAAPMPAPVGGGQLQAQPSCATMRSSKRAPRVEARVARRIVRLADRRRWRHRREEASASRSTYSAPHRKVTTHQTPSVANIHCTSSARR